MVCCCAQRLPTAAASKTGHPLRLPPKRLEDPISPLGHATTFPAPCARPGAEGGGRGRSSDETGARAAARSARTPHAHPRGAEAQWRTLGAGPRPAASGSRRARTRVGVGGRGATSARRVRARSLPARPPAQAGRLGPGARHEGREGGEKGVGPQDRRGPSGGCGALAGAGRTRLRSWRRQRQRRRREKMVALEVGAAGAELYSQAWHQRCH